MMIFLMKPLKSILILYILPTRVSFPFIHAVYGLADARPGDINSEGSVSDDGHEAKDDGCSADEGSESSDDDLVIEFDDMYGGDPLDLDYED